MMTFFIAVGAIALFILGLSITLMRKGHNIQGDVGENDEMKKLGLRCTIEEMTDRGCNSTDPTCCSTCTTDCSAPASR